MRVREAEGEQLTAKESMYCARACVPVCVCVSPSVFELCLLIIKLKL